MSWVVYKKGKTYTSKPAWWRFILRYRIKKFYQNVKPGKRIKLASKHGLTFTDDFTMHAWFSVKAPEKEEK